MPKKFPEEFKRDVVRVARRGDLTLAEVAADFAISVESRVELDNLDASRIADLPVRPYLLRGERTGAVTGSVLCSMTTSPSSGLTSPSLTKRAAALPFATKTTVDLAPPPLNTVMTPSAPDVSGPYPSAQVPSCTPRPSNERAAAISRIPLVARVGSA